MVVSREHAALHFHDGVWHVLELRARNGTWVNGERLVPGVEMPLCAGDVVQLANVELVFEMREREGVPDKEPERDAPPRSEGPALD
jgi:pSer/pThr/pTyr-binding forkhead associated (FHA) protein